MANVGQKHLGKEQKVKKESTMSSGNMSTSQIETKQRKGIIDKRKFDESSLELLWEEAPFFGKDMKDLSYLKYHLGFSKVLTEKILAIDPKVRMKITPTQFSFYDDLGIGPFFELDTKKSKVTVGPLRLRPEDLKGLNCKFRDITEKKYRMGGLVRVDLSNFDDNDLKIAFELAKKSFAVKEKIGPAAFFKDNK